MIFNYEPFEPKPLTVDEYFGYELPEDWESELEDFNNNYLPKCKDSDEVEMWRITHMQMWDLEMRAPDED